MRAKDAVSVPVFNNEYGHGVPEQRPENSVYYHPTLNPSGVPPPGKPQRYRTDPAAGPRVPLPVPAAPPLPAGPAPGVPQHTSVASALSVSEVSSICSGTCSVPLLLVMYAAYSFTEPLHMAGLMHEPASCALYLASRACLTAYVILLLSLC